MLKSCWQRSYGKIILHNRLLVFIPACNRRIIEYWLQVRPLFKLDSYDKNHGRFSIKSPLQEDKKNRKAYNSAKVAVLDWARKPKVAVVIA